MQQLLASGLLAIAFIVDTPAQPDPSALLQDLRSAIHREDLTTAADVASRLDETIQARYRSWLIRDSDVHVNESLKWLPPDTESLFVNQEPFTINSEEAPEESYGERPIQAQSMDRLSALNQGMFYRVLSGRTIRFVIAGARHLQKNLDQAASHGAVAAQDYIYFYYFEGPVELPTPDESISDSPVWRGVAQVDSGAPYARGVERTMNDDENWLALPRPNLLVLTNRKSTLRDVLDRIAHGSKTRALPATLPEWAYVNRRMSFWGLRHYSDTSKPQAGERGFSAAALPQPDGRAVGVAMQFDGARQELAILYLSDSQLDSRRGRAHLLRSEFVIDQPQTGVWRLIADIHQRGAYPVQFGMIMLGFGMYR